MIHLSLIFEVMDPKIVEKEVEESARIYADLPEGFDFKEESYYQPHKIEKYNAFKAGALKAAELIYLMIESQFSWKLLRKFSTLS